MQTEPEPEYKKLLAATLQMLATGSLVFEAADLVAVLSSREEGKNKADIVKIIAEGFLKAGRRVVDHPDHADPEAVTHLNNISHLLCILAAASVTSSSYNRPLRLSPETYDSGSVPCETTGPL